MGPKHVPLPPSKPYKLTSLLANTPSLHHKMKILLHDLRNVKSNPDSTRRIETTVDELYISSPYFTPEEAGQVKGALVLLPAGREFSFRLEEYEGEYEEGDANFMVSGGDPATRMPIERKDVEDENRGDGAFKEMTVEQAIKFYLSGFLEKRKASGDARPCGPHDLSPVYEFVFGISREELSDVGFLRRVRREGLGLGKEVEIRACGGGKEDGKKYDRKAAKAKDKENRKGNGKKTS